MPPHHSLMDIAHAQRIRAIHMEGPGTNERGARLFERSVGHDAASNSTRVCSTPASVFSSDRNCGDRLEHCDWLHIVQRQCPTQAAAVHGSSRFMAAAGSCTATLARSAPPCRRSPISQLPMHEGCRRCEARRAKDLTLGTRRPCRRSSWTLAGAKIHLPCAGLHHHRPPLLQWAGCRGTAMLRRRLLSRPRW